MTTNMKRQFSFALVAVGLILQGCSSGSGGSSVGETSQVPPTARAQVLNAGQNNTFREGSEVLLTGKASEDADGPVLAWAWRQTAGPAVRLIERNTTTVSFTAPDVSANATLTFELTVRDSSNDTSTSNASVTIVPARDADRFLSLDTSSEGQSPFDTFVAIPTLASGASTGPAAKPFTLSAVAYVVYPPRSTPNAVCTINVNDFAAAIPSQVAGGCLVSQLENLTPTALTGEWLANVGPVAVSADPTKAELDGMWWNSRFVLKVPRLDVDDFNQQFVNNGQRDRMLDQFNAHRARIVLSFALTAPSNQGQASLVFTDAAGAPLTLPMGPSTTPGVRAKIFPNAGGGLPTLAVVEQEQILGSIVGRESALTSAVYYKTVDPDDERLTLNAWLQRAGFTAQRDGVLAAAARSGTGQFAHAIYLNNYDLGFGRDMYSRTDEFGNVYSFVTNYATLEGAIRKTDPIVTVVMEYSPLRGVSDPKRFVKFFTYADDGSGDSRRVSSMNFDGRGERFTPGNCVICHGGSKPPGLSDPPINNMRTNIEFLAACGDRSNATCYAWPQTNRDGHNIADGNLNATFLPWDVNSLLFADNDPAIVNAPVPFDGISLRNRLTRDYGDFSRATQAAQIRKLNQAAYETYCSGQACPTDPARRLLEHWYDGVDQQGNLVGAFDDSTAVPGWESGAPLYHNVYAPHCRMCHTNITDETLRFDTYQKFETERSRIRTAVFARGVMPAARLTMDRLWTPFAGGRAPGELLAEHLAAIDNAPAPVAPGSAVAEIGGFDGAPTRGAIVRLDASDSLFARTHQWSLTRPAGSNAVLVGASTVEPAFVVDVPGEYRVSLVVNAGTPSEAVDARQQVVLNRIPRAEDDSYTLDLRPPSSGPLQGSVLVGQNQDNDPDGDPLSVAPIAGQGPQFGSLTLNPNGSFVYTYTSASTTQLTDSFGYRVSDAFGGSADARAVITFQRPIVDTTPPTNPVLQSVADQSATNGSAFRLRLTWSASTDPNNGQVASYDIYRRTGNSPAPFSFRANTSSTSYDDLGVSPDQEYTYYVRARDAAVPANVSGQSNQLGTRVDTSFSLNVLPIFSAQTCSSSCHTGTPPAGGSGSLSLDANVAYSELRTAADAGPRVVVGTARRSSLLLCRPSDDDDVANTPCAQDSHVTFFPSMGEIYQLIDRWIEDGAPNN